MFPKRSNLKGDCNPRCTRRMKNIRQSNYSSQSKCASPEGAQLLKWRRTGDCDSVGSAGCINHCSEEDQDPGMRKRISDMELYVHSSNLQRLKRVLFLTLQHKEDSRLERVAPTSQPLQWGLKENQQELQQNLSESQRSPPWILTLIWKSY